MADMGIPSMVLNRDYEPQILVYKSIFYCVQNGCPLGAKLELTLVIAPGKDFVDSIFSESSFYWTSSHVGLERANMHSRTSNVGDSFRISASSTPSNSSGGSDPDDLESVGDVYIWGEVMVDGVSPDGTRNQVPSKTDILIPKPLDSNVLLDVRYISSGAHHIAIVTKQGEAFTWGEESGGRLGHGVDKDFGHPRLVKFHEVANLDLVACGEYHTCAVSKTCETYMWGDGTHNAGLLGNGNEASHWIPKRVNGPLEGLQVISIACGTWHSALATSNGKLFTFGDGAFGVLGHGDEESVLYPKEVQVLSGLKTIKVACGVWHTAAIVEVTFQSGSNVPSWKLFTWGDGDKYRLGHGDKETHLQPTRVSPLTEYNFHQVACGHTMTIALTTTGHVFTMGDTENGQLGNPMSIGKVPTLVQDKLLGEYVEEISCGAHHVAVLTSRNELYTWGMGDNGRLGHGDTDDKKSPTFVVAMKDRHIKNISCGSNFTCCICIHKWVSGTDQSVCSNCRQAFGLTRKRHNCHNCGLIFCHACSSRKALRAALSPTPEKPHRVCDNCYNKLKMVEDTCASKFDRKATPSHSSVSGRERSSQAVVRSTITLLSPITEPVKYHEIKSSKPGSKDESTFFIRASQVPSLLQLKDIAFPISQTPPPAPTNSRPMPRYTTRHSPPRPASPRFSGSLIDGLKKTNVVLNQEVLKLQKEIQNLKEIRDMQDVEIQKLQKKSTEASALAAVEYCNHTITKEFMGSTIYKMKEMTEKLPEEIPQSKDFRTVITQVEDFLKEISEAETSPPLTMSESKQQNAPNIFASRAAPSKLQRHRLEENVNVVEVDPYQDGLNSPEESNGSKLESKQQNTPDIPTTDTSTSKLQESRLEENVDASKVDPCQDGGKLLEESEEIKLEEDILASTSDTSKLEKHRLEQNVDATGVGHSEAGGHVLQESNGSSISSVEETLPAQNSSRSLESGPGRQELQVIEKFEPGVYVTLLPQLDGTKTFKRVKFSKRRFTENQAEEWWTKNKSRVLRKYSPSPQKLITESPNVTLHAKENIEELPS